jgi:hypothetical protein
MVLADNLDNRTARVRTQGCSGGNMLADAIFKIFPDADMSLITGGFIRGDRLYKKGFRISRPHLDDEFPFFSPKTSSSVSVFFC